MLPVTRANLDHICCICLMDITPSVFTQKVYDVKEESNLSKILKLTAHITVLKNPMNQKYINDYCRKICEICFLKTQYSYSFREKIVASTASVKELLESGELNEVDVERLQYFCRICLNRQEGIANDGNCLKRVHYHWLKNCSGIRYTSFVDTEKFRIKEGTNINEIAEINDTYFPRQLCQNCLKKLQNVEEFRKSATQSFEYMISVMGDVSAPELELVTPCTKQQHEEKFILKEIHQAPKLIIENNNHVRKDSTILPFEDNNIDECKQEETFSTDVFEVPMQQDIYSNDPIVSEINFTKISKVEDITSENIMDLMEDLSKYSDEDADDANFGLNSVYDESSTTDCSEEECKNTYFTKTPVVHNEDEDKSSRLRKTRAKQSNKTNENSCKIEEKSIESECSEELKQKRNKKIKLTKNGNEKKSRKKRTKLLQSEDANNTNNKATEVICGECSKMFTSNYALRRHKKNVHTPESLQTWYTCEVCSKRFKRKKHLDEHIQAVHEKLRPFKCSYCTKCFTAKSSKKNHELTHTDNFPYVCEWCEKGFRRSHQLKVHLEIHTTSPELLCPICKRSQKTTEDLEDHLKSHDEKRLQCPWCGKLFNRSSHLKDHQNAVHLKLRPFKCDFCELAFGDRKARLVHQKSHTEDRPITCNVCKRGFKTRSTFKRHINESGHESENFNNKPKKTKKKPDELPSLNYSAPFNSIFEV